MTIRFDSSAAMGFDFGLDSSIDSMRERIALADHRSEPAIVADSIALARFSPRALAAAQALAANLANTVRAKRAQAAGVDALMLEFSLDSREGVALMCLAEALLRIPDAATRDRADPRQDRPRRLARASRRIAVAVRQRRRMGPARHRQARRYAQRGRARTGARVAACARAASR